MNKLLILALLGLVIIAVTGAESKEEETSSELEALANREVREAGKNNKKKGNKNKKAGRKSKKSKRKSRKNKKKSAKKNKKSGKKNRKSNNKREKKAKKSKKNKSVKKAKKGKKASKKSSKGKSNKPSQRQSSCLNYTCVDKAVGYLKMLKDKVSNFEKQDSRITRQNRTGMGKAGKKGLFGPVVRRITEHGGGNTSNLTCNGQKNAGAAQLTNLTETLLKCETDIVEACAPKNLPAPNKTEVDECNDAIKVFKVKSTACIKKSGSEACTCWDDKAIETASSTIKKCDLSKGSKDFAKALKECTKVFGKCRKYEDDVGNAIHNCNQDTSVLKSKLKNLKANSDALTNFKSKIDNLSSSRQIRSRSPRQTSCSAVISVSTTVVSLVVQSPHSFKIFSLIQTVISVTVTCTTQEKTALKKASVSVQESITRIQIEVTHVQEVYEGLTGSKATDEEIAAAKTCKTEEDCDSAVEPSEPEPSTSPVPAPAPAPSSGSPTPTPAPAPAPAPESPTPAPAPAPEAPTPSPAPAPEAPTPSPAPAPEAPTPSPTPAPEAPTPSPAPAPESPTPSPAPAPEAPSPSPAPAPEAPSPSPAPAPESPSPSPAPAPETPSPSPAPAPETPSPSPAPAPEAPTPAPAPEAPSPAPTPETPAPAPAPSPQAPSPAPAPAPQSPSPAPAPSPESPTPLPASSSGAPSSAAPSSAAPSSAAPSSSAASSVGPTTPMGSTTPHKMTTGASTRRARRFVQQMMQNRMIKNM